MLREELVNIIQAQQEYYMTNNEYTSRDLQTRIDWTTSNATIISGVRRCGKSTLMRQGIIDSNLKAGYLHFDDPRLNDFKVFDFYILEEIWKDKDILQFDEIHRVHGWESYVRQATERKRKIAITGSNANLMSSELGTLLTGRHLTYELFPFSYHEYLNFLGKTAGTESWLEYLHKGGFPDAIKHNEVQYHVDLLNDILQKDIVVRRGIRNYHDLFTIALHMLNNIARPFTSTRLSKNYKIKSVKTVTDYIGFLEDVYLIFVVPRYSASFKQQVNNQKKIYAIDHAFARNNSTQFQDDLGRQLENMVFIELRNRTKEIFYYQEKNECDFVIMERGKGYSCYQVSLNINQQNKDREINGLISALHNFDLSEGTIITLDQEDKIIEENKTIHLIPFWKWAG